jgi:photosystem II stability/assembly factor-like uncharacterized protein
VLIAILAVALLGALVVGVLIFPFFGAALHLHGLGTAPASAAAITSIAMVSPTEGWAVGRNGDQGLILHNTQGSWARATIPANTGKLASIFMLSASEGWAVGNSTILHYQAGQWSAVSFPGASSFPLHLTSVFMISASEGWAIGDSAILLHYQAGTWSQVSPSSSTELNSLFMVRQPMAGP